MALPKNIVNTNECCIWIVPLNWNDIKICVTGCIRYAQYVKRLNGNNARYDNKLSIGLANPHLHDNVTHINAKPHASYMKNEKKKENLKQCR